MTSTISYDRDHPHEMQMVWEIWLKENGDLPDTTINDMYDKWLSGKSTHGVTYGLIIPQTEWNKIVVAYL